MKGLLYDKLNYARISFKRLSKKNEDNDVFYEAKIDLSVDFSSVSYVFVIENILIQEQDSLQLEAIND